MKEQAVSMLTPGLWGVPGSAQLRTKLLPGDGLIIAVGSPLSAIHRRRRARFPIPPVLRRQARLPARRTRIRSWLDVDARACLAESIPIEMVWVQVTAAVMNARRAKQGKPPLTPGQNAQVIDNRRAERDKVAPSTTAFRREATLPPASAWRPAAWWAASPTRGCFGGGRAHTAMPASLAQRQRGCRLLSWSHGAWSRTVPV